VELTPKVDPVPAPSRPPRRWMAGVVVVVLLVVIGGLVYKGLSDATLYFRNADEAIAEREELGDRWFRLQGTVVDDPVEQDGALVFEVTYNGAVVEVHHTGDAPGEMFKPDTPAVLEGRWDDSGAFFASDNILVKHDETYETEEDYQKRMQEADEGAATP
jgi:cytochrome c-type biogenesis protein CcmE